MSFFDLLGGEPGVRALVDRFYDLMEALPDAAAIRAMHPPDLRMSRHKLHLFLVGWTGGPPLYVQQYGHPRLRARHLPFPIDDAAADAWMTCMSRALEEEVEDEIAREQLRRALERLALHMRNEGGLAITGPGLGRAR